MKNYFIICGLYKLIKKDSCNISYNNRPRHINLSSCAWYIPIFQIKNYIS